MELYFAGYEGVLLNALDGIVRSRTCVDSAINNTERTCTQDSLNPQCSVIDRLAQEPGRRRSVRHLQVGIKGYQLSPDFSVLSRRGGLVGSERF